MHARRGKIGRPRKEEIVEHACRLLDTYTYVDVERKIESWVDRASGREIVMPSSKELIHILSHARWHKVIVKGDRNKHVRTTYKWIGT